MLRDTIKGALPEAMKAKDRRATSTLRLILATIKDRDIAARGNGETEGISNDEVMKVLQTMIKQRRESIKLYEQGERQDLADQEAEEIIIIETFLPRQLSADEIAEAVAAVLEESGANSLKDMGPMMALLRKRHAGSMDFGKASALLKQKLG